MTPTELDPDRLRTMLRAAAAIVEPPPPEHAPEASAAAAPRGRPLSILAAVVVVAAIVTAVVLLQRTPAHRVAASVSGSPSASPTPIPTPTPTEGVGLGGNITQREYDAGGLVFKMMGRFPKIPGELRVPVARRHQFDALWTYVPEPVVQPGQSAYVQWRQFTAPQSIGYVISYLQTHPWDGLTFVRRVVPHTPGSTEQVLIFSHRPARYVTHLKVIVNIAPYRGGVVMRVQAEGVQNQS